MEHLVDGGNVAEGEHSFAHSEAQAVSRSKRNEAPKRGGETQRPAGARACGRKDEGERLETRIWDRRN